MAQAWAKINLDRPMSRSNNLALTHSIRALEFSHGRQQ